MTDYFIGIDIGTGSTKAIAVDHSGRLIASSRVAYPTLSPKPGYSEQEPSSILKAFKSCIHQITTKLKKTPQAVSISSAMHSVIPVDSQGRALMNMMTWGDNRSKDVADRLRHSADAKSIYKDGGTALHAMSPITKVAWLREQEPDLFGRTHKFISIKEYIWYHLFGVFQIDYSLASATGMFHILGLKWNQTALTFAGITADRLSAPVNTDATMVTPSGLAADEMNLPPGVPFFIGGSDGCLANLGSLAIQPGTAALTIGTSGAIRVTSKAPVYNYETMPFNYLLDASTFICGGAVNNGGAALKWYAEHLLLKELTTPAHYQNLLDALHRTPAGSEGLTFLPYLQGERAPLWDSNASGAFFGMTTRHHQVHFTRAVLEGISMALYDVGKTLEDGGLGFEKINVSGGFVHNEQWLQLLADIFGKDIYLINAEDASALGAIYLAMKAMGTIPDYEHFTPHGVKVFHPDPANVDVYKNTVFPRYQRLYKATKDEMALLGNG